MGCGSGLRFRTLVDEVLHVRRQVITEPEERELVVECSWRQCNPHLTSQSLTQGGPLLGNHGKIVAGGASASWPSPVLPPHNITPDKLASSRIRLVEGATDDERPESCAFHDVSPSPSRR